MLLVVPFEAAVVPLDREEDEDETSDVWASAAEEPSKAAPCVALEYPCVLVGAAELLLTAGIGAGVLNSAPNDGSDRPKRSPGGNRDSSVSSRSCFGSRGRGEGVTRRFFHWFNQFIFPIHIFFAAKSRWGDSVG